MNDLAALEARLGLTFHDPALLRRALTHRSYLNEYPDDVNGDNERLEFLGDAALDFIVGAYLYRRFPDLPEGELTALRAALVRARTLADFARQLELGAHLRLGHGEAETGGRRRTATLCAAFEAVIGAVYVDQGLERLQPWLERLLEPALERIRAQALHKDAKSEFQVWAQSQFNVTPHYALVAAEGPDHAKLFTMRVMIADEIWGEGQGPSKQAAAQAAAWAALDKAAATEARAS